MAATDPDTDEFAIIARCFAPLATAPGSRALKDDAATIDGLVVTVDTIVEGVHFLPTDPIETIAQKALRVNLSDLAAKGCAPLHYLLALQWPAGRAAAEVDRFARGLAADQALFGVTLLGGDTTSTPGPLAVTVTAFGRPFGRVPSRTDACPGDDVWITGAVGAGRLGLEVARGNAPADFDQVARSALLAHYRSPMPRLDCAAAIAGLANATMDVSDGLLADAAKIAAASSVQIVIDLDQVPLPPSAAAWFAPQAVDRVWLATGGDDYEVLFTAPQSQRDAAAQFAARIGAVHAGEGLVTRLAGEVVVAPAQGYSHRLGG